jgi:uncharacterized iron-regulated membrane protein
MKEKKKKSTWQKVRKFFNDVHLWLGLASGLVVFVVCLSGTMYVFNSEIQQYMDRDKYTIPVPEGGKALPVEALMTSLIDTLGAGAVQSVRIPNASDQVYVLNVRKVEPQKDKEKNREGKDGKREDIVRISDSSSVSAAEGAEKTAPREKRRSKETSVVEGAAGGQAKEKPVRPRRDRGVNYLVDPYTGTLLGKAESETSQFFAAVLRLHRWLLLDNSIGRPITGTSCIIFVLMLLTGIVIWFPGQLKAWKQGLKIMFSAKWKRVNHDLHNTLGFYSFLVLLIISLTGLTWSFEWYKDGFHKVLGTYTPADKRPESPKSIVSADTLPTKITLAQLLQTTDSLLPYPGEYRIAVPSEADGVVTVSKSKTDLVRVVSSDRVLFDQYTGDVLKVEKFSDKPFNEQIAGSVKAIHTGEIFGLFSKIIYFIAALVATSLPVTGTIIWINKLRKKDKKKNNKATSSRKKVAESEQAKV